MSANRQKRWHHKTRSGCNTCRARRVKCDELYPVCDNCAKAGRKCEYTTPPTRWVVTLGPPVTSSTEPSAIATRDFEFYTRVAAPIYGAWQSPKLFCTTLPAISEASSAAKSGLLALSVSLQHLAGTSTDAAVLSKRGDLYFGQACSKLAKKSCATVEEALLVCLLLWATSMTIGRDVNQWAIHCQAFLRLLTVLESNEAEVHSDEFQEDHRRSLAEQLRSHLRAIHIPYENQFFLDLMDQRVRWLPDGKLSEKQPKTITLTTNTFGNLTTPRRINAFFWMIVMAPSKQSLYIIRQALEGVSLQCKDGVLPKPITLDTFHIQVRILLLLLELYVLDEPIPKQRNTDGIMNEILDKISEVLKMWTAADCGRKRNDDPEYGAGQKGIQNYSGILLGVIGTQAHNPAIRTRALNMFRYNGVDPD